MASNPQLSGGRELSTIEQKQPFLGSLLRRIISYVNTQATNTSAATSQAITALTGDVTATTPGVSTATVTGVNQASVPVSAAVVGTNDRGQLVETSVSEPLNTPLISHQWLDSYDATSGAFGQSQPAFSDISGTATPSQLPVATTSALGVVQPDGSTITVSSGVITAVGGGGGNATSIQGVPVSATAPTNGQVLEYNGTDWVPTTPSGGGGGGGGGLAEGTPISPGMTGSSSNTGWNGWTWACKIAGNQIVQDAVTAKVVLEAIGGTGISINQAVVAVTARDATTTISAPTVITWNGGNASYATAFTGASPTAPWRITSDSFSLNAQEDLDYYFFFYFDNDGTGYNANLTLWGDPVVGALWTFNDWNSNNVPSGSGSSVGTGYNQSHAIPMVSLVAGAPTGGSGSGGGGLWSGLITVPSLTNPLTLTNKMNLQGSFSATANSAGLSLVDLTGKGSDFVEGILDSYPTAPFTLTWLQSAESFGSYNNTGLVVADSLTGAVMLFGFRWGSGGPWEPWVLTYSTPNSSPGAVSSPSISLSGLVWFQFEDDGTNISFSYSIDGVYFIQTYTVAKASSFLGSSGFNYLGFGMESYSGVQMTILSLGFAPPPGGGSGVPLAISETPDWPPANPTAWDDEFTGNTLNTSLWTSITNGVPNTLTVSNSYLAINCAAHGGDNFTTVMQAAPSGNWTFQTKVEATGFNYNYFYGGLTVGDSGGKTLILQVQNGPGVVVNHWNSNTNFSSQPLAWAAMNTDWYFEARYDGTNIYFSVSQDGGEGSWQQIYQEGATSFLSSVSYIGVSGGSNDGSHPCTFSYDWFRRTA